ncbi:hypothetical protein LOK49_LG09G02354 [Camellia lanceoleosa]|uniref:Uncharacterized protein n=1 Tax=Camellia lanceoleosa TaxID=1840588 RepID=A0ACC0GHM8_9ERIC|nr:hypothetical protein LOK49_LG09G02354 [Camellia lanceoleosa]
MLCTKVRKLWALQDEFNAIDLGNNYFLFKVSSQEDCARVFSGGLWVILDHYLTIRKWEADVKASEAFKTTTAVWVRFLQLPIEYFHEKVSGASTSLSLIGLESSLVINKPIKTNTKSPSHSGGPIASQENPAVHTIPTTNRLLL